MNETINLLKDAVSIMIPVITGFIVLFGGSLGKLWQTADVAKRKNYPWRKAGISIFLALVSLFACFGVMSICIKASIDKPSQILWFKEVTPEQMIIYSKRYLNIAYTFFSAAIGFAALCYYKIIRDNT